jgi:hypothetical protein
LRIEQSDDAQLERIKDVAARLAALLGSETWTRG